MFNVKASLALGGGEIRMRDEGVVMIEVGRELAAETPKMLPGEKGKGQTSWIPTTPIPHPRPEPGLQPDASQINK